MTIVLFRLSSLIAGASRLQIIAAFQISLRLPTQNEALVLWKKASLSLDEIGKE